MVMSLRSKWAAGPAAAGREEGAYLNRYVTDEQRGRRPIFNATLRAAASWLFFRPAAAGLDPYESKYGRFARASKNSQLIRRPPGDITIICETVH
jgi:hypothetical protein